MHQNDYSLEVCTCVCKIQEESPAHLSGLQIGNYSCIFSGSGWPYLAFLSITFVVEHVEGVHVLQMLVFAFVYL